MFETQIKKLPFATIQKLSIFLLLSQLVYLQSLDISPVFSFFFVFAFAFGLVYPFTTTLSEKILRFIYLSGFLSGLIYSLHLQIYFVTLLFFLNYFIYINLNRPVFKNYLWIFLLSSFVFFLMIIRLKPPSLSIYFIEVFFIFLLLLNMFFLILRYDLEHNHIIKHQQGKSSRRVGVNRLLNSKNILDKKLLLFVVFISTALVIFASITTYFVSDKYFSFNQQKHKKQLKLPNVLDLNRKGKISLSNNQVLSLTSSGPLKKKRFYLRGKTLSDYFKGIWRSNTRVYSAQINESADVFYRYKLIQYSRVNHGFTILGTYKIKSLDPDLKHIFLDDHTVYFENLPEDHLEYTIFVKNGDNYLNKKVQNKFLTIPLEIKITLEKILPEEILKLGDTKKTDLIVEKVEEFLSNYQYGDTYLKPKKNQDPNVYFLTRIKKGPCGLFASSATLILRYLGIPARLVLGFSKFSNGEMTLNFKGKNAHSWVEYYHSEKGWQLFDPTVNSRSEFNSGKDKSAEDKNILIKILLILIPIILVLIYFIVDELNREQKKRRTKNQRADHKIKKKKISITTLEASAIFNQLINSDYFKNNPRKPAESAQNYGLRLSKEKHPGAEKIVLASKLANEVLFSNKPKEERQKILNKLKKIQKELIDFN